MVNLATIALSTLFSAGACASVPYIANRLMRTKRAAHKEWFISGAKECLKKSAEGIAWAETLPRLIADRAISYEDVCEAKSVGATNIDENVDLPTKIELDASYQIPSEKRVRLAAVLLVAGLLYGGILAISGVTAYQTIVLGAIGATCALVALIDIRCRMIPNITIALLCALGAALHMLNQEAFLIPALALMSLFVCAGMYAIDALYARSRKGLRSIGDGDKKVMAAIVICSGISGIFTAFVTLLISLLLALFKKKNRKAKQAFGPYAALAVFTGATASILM